MLEMDSRQRLSELDWLRVFLILAVFLHHALMPFNGDDWHIMNRQSSKLLDDVMVYFEQFRLPTLFFIAGVGSVILLDRVRATQFLKDKFSRLFIPLMVGIIFIVPPQTYIEHIESFDSYWAAYPELLQNFEANHLWFIEYLVVFSLLAIPLNALLSSGWAKSFLNKLAALSDQPNGLFFLVLILILMRLSLWLYFPDDGHDIANLSSSVFYLFFFFAGMTAIHSKKVWLSFATNRRRSLYWLLGSSVLFYGYYFGPDVSKILALQTRWLIWHGLCSLVMWAALLTLLGYAQHYLTTTPSWLKTSNELIYPFYILHQTVIILIGYYIIAVDIPLFAKALILMIGALLVSAGICYYVIRPFNPARLIFGLKRNTRNAEPTRV